ncbi:hypothetical protein SMICM304S_10362 [Streptomyces microflavus]
MTGPPVTSARTAPSGTMASVPAKSRSSSPSKSSVNRLKGNETPP